MDKYVKWLDTLVGKAVLVTSLAIITLFFGWHLQFLAFDFEFEKFFPGDHPDTRLYQDHVAQFGYDNDFMQIILENEKGVFRPEFLLRAQEFERRLSSIKDVESVYSVLSLKHVIKSPTGLMAFPLLHPDDDRKLRQDSIRIFENPFYSSSFSADGKATSIYLGHAHFNDPVRGERLLRAINSLAAELELKDQIRLVGKLAASKIFIEYIQKDFGKFLIGSLIVSFLLLLLIFGSLKSSVLPFLISLLSIVWSFGLMSFLGYKINLLSSLLPPIIFFVSMSDAVHLMNALQKAEKGEKLEMIISALKVVWTPTLLASVTTATGFLSLIWINTEPVRLLGLFAAIGITFSFLLTFTLGVFFATVTDYSTKKRIVFGLPSSLIDFLTSHKRQVAAGIAIMVILSLPGLLKLKIDAYLLDDLPKSSALRQDFEYADQHLGGSKPYEIRVDVMDSSLSVWDKQVMDEVAKIERYLSSEYPIAKLQSPLTIIKYLTMVNHGGLNAFYRYPEFKKDYEETLNLKRRIDPKRLNRLVTEDGKTARLIGFIPELGSRETIKRNEQLMTHLDSTINKQLITYRITGTTYLIDKSHELISKNLFAGLFTAIGVIGAILGLYFKSWKLVIISLLPNLIPLIMIAGILGWAGISLKMTTAIIFTITFGIAVDDTIHIMSHYRQGKEESPMSRMKSTFKQAGSAILITTIIITSGFVLFLFSNFGASYYLGLFMSMSLTIALIIDLTLLPLLLITFQKHAKKGR